MVLVEHPWLSAVVAPGLDDTVYQALGYMCMTSDQVRAGAFPNPNTSFAAPFGTV
jgi:hypothetical protein